MNTAFIKGLDHSNSQSGPSLRQIPVMPMSGSKNERWAMSVSMLMAASSGLMLPNAALAISPGRALHAEEGRHTGDATALAMDSIAAGAGSKAYSIGATAYGGGSEAGHGKNAAANTAIGFEAKAINKNWEIREAGERRSDNLGWKITSLTGHAAAVAVGARSVAESGGVALGSYASAGAIGSLAVGSHSNAIGRNSLALGSAAYSSHLQSLAIGSFSASVAERATAIGALATARGVDANAIGTSAQATGERAIALGSAKTANVNYDTKQNTTDNTRATGDDSIAIGTNARAWRGASIAIGLDSEAALDNAVAMGSGANAQRPDSVAIGRFAKADGDNAISIGLQSSATGSVAIAVGYGARAIAYGTALGSGAQVNSMDSVALGSSSIAMDPVSTADGVIAGDIYAYAGANAQSVVSLGNDTRKRQVTHVAAGRLNATSTDAVNGSQLDATNRAVTKVNNRAVNGLQGLANALGGEVSVAEDGSITAPSYVVNKNDNTSVVVHSVGSAIDELNQHTTQNTTNINNLSNQISNGSVGLVQQLAPGEVLTVGKKNDGAAVDFTGREGARSLIGVKAGGADTDAVNVAQLKDVVASLGGGAAVNANGSITSPSYVVNKDADGNGGTIHNNAGDAITNIDARTTTNTLAINHLDERLVNGAIGLVQQDEGSRYITIAKDRDGAKVDFKGTAGARTLESVAIGIVNASSMQAINGSQLYGVSLSMANSLGGEAIVNADGTISAPSYRMDGTLVNNVGDALSNLDGRVKQHTRSIADLMNDLYGLDGEPKLFRYEGSDSHDDNYEEMRHRIDHLENRIINVGSGDSSLINANVADGSRQAATASGGNSLTAGNAATALGDNSTALGNDSQAKGENSVALGNSSIADRPGSVSVGSQGKERQVTNVAAGTEDTDAVNMAQYQQTVRYNQRADGSTDYSRVSLGQQGTPVTLSNVTNGRIAADSSDAINGSQMYDWTLNRDNKYSNASLSHQIDKVERNMQAGIATALAARQAPYVPGKTTYAVGAAGYKSQGAVGISTRFTAESGRWSLEGGFSRNGDGTGVYVGVSGVLGD